MNQPTCSNCKFWRPGSIPKDATRYHIGNCVNLEKVYRFVTFRTHNNSSCQRYEPYEKIKDPLQDEEALRKNEFLTRGKW